MCCHCCLSLEDWQAHAGICGIANPCMRLPVLRPPTCDSVSLGLVRKAGQQLRAAAKNGAQLNPGALTHTHTRTQMANGLVTPQTRSGNPHGCW